jgi:hypothetical protein
MGTEEQGRGSEHIKQKKVLEVTAESQAQPGWGLPGRRREWWEFEVNRIRQRMPPGRGIKGSVEATCSKRIL